MKDTDPKAASLLALMRGASRDAEALDLLARSEIEVRPARQHERWRPRVDVVFRVAREDALHDSVGARVRIEHAVRDVLGAGVRFVRWEPAGRSGRAQDEPEASRPVARPLRRPTPRRPLGRSFMRRADGIPGGEFSPMRTWRTSG